MAIVTLLVAAFTVTPALGLVLGVEPEMEQSVVMLGGDHNHVATMSTVPATGSTSGDVFLAPEGEDAVTAIAALHQDIYFIDKQHCKLPLKQVAEKWGRDRPFFADRD
jgi:hypothetical protein